VWKRAVVATLIFGNVAGCTFDSLGPVPRRDIDIRVENRSDQRIEFQTGGATDAQAPLEMIVEACTSSSIQRAEASVGDTLSVDREVVWRFDELPPDHIGGMVVVVHRDGTASVETAEVIVGSMAGPCS
jgi:hypothetical protein